MLPAPYNMWSLKLREPSSAQRFTEGPRYQHKNDQQGNRKEDERGLMLFSIVRQLFDLRAADMHERNGYQCHQRMLDGEEPERRRFHSSAHIAKGGLGQRTDHEQDQSEQHLNVQEDHKEQAGLFIGGRPGRFAANAHRCTNKGPNAEQQDQPSNKRVNDHQSIMHDN